MPRVVQGHVPIIHVEFSQKMTLTWWQMNCCLRIYIVNSAKSIQISGDYMELESFLIKKKEAILNRWLMLIMEMYPEESSHQYMRANDKFTNPVGHIMSEETKLIYEEILKDMDFEKLTVSLENILRIRAVQDFSPARATSFIFLLKNAIREETEREIKEDKLCVQLLNFELKIDRLALFAFNLYTKCRDAICEIRIKEIKDETARALSLLQKMNLANSDKD